jgi:hypothetical protein
VTRQLQSRSSVSGRRQNSRSRQFSCIAARLNFQLGRGKALAVELGSDRVHPGADILPRAAHHLFAHSAGDHDPFVFPTGLACVRLSSLQLQKPQGFQTAVSALVRVSIDYKHAARFQLHTWCWPSRLYRLSASPGLSAFQPGCHIGIVWA